jgi:hypothetical protein
MNKKDILFFNVSFVDPTPIFLNHIGGVMVSVLASSAVDRGFWWRNG